VQNWADLEVHPYAIEGLGEAETQNQNLSSEGTAPVEGNDPLPLEIGENTNLNFDGVNTFDGNLDLTDLLPNQMADNYHVSKEDWDDFECTTNNAPVAPMLPPQQFTGQDSAIVPNGDILGTLDQQTDWMSNDNGTQSNLIFDPLADFEANNGQDHESFSQAQDLRNQPSVVNHTSLPGSNQRSHDVTVPGDLTVSGSNLTFTGFSRQEINAAQMLFGNLPTLGQQFDLNEELTSDNRIARDQAGNPYSGNYIQQPLNSAPTLNPIPTFPAATLEKSSLTDYTIPDFQEPQPKAKARSRSKGTADEENWDSYPNGVPEFFTSPFPEYECLPEDPDTFLGDQISWKQLSPYQLMEWSARAPQHRDLLHQKIIPRLVDYPGADPNDNTEAKKEKINSNSISMREQRLREANGQFMGDAKFMRKRPGENKERPTKKFEDILEKTNGARLLHGTIGHINKKRWSAVTLFTGGGLTGRIEFPLREPMEVPEEIAAGIIAAGYEPPNLHDHLLANRDIWQHFFPEDYNHGQLPERRPRPTFFKRMRGNYSPNEQKTAGPKANKRGRSNNSSNRNGTAELSDTQPFTMPPQNNQYDSEDEHRPKKRRTTAAASEIPVQHQPSYRIPKPRVISYKDRLQRRRQERGGQIGGQRFSEGVQTVSANVGAQQAQLQPQVNFGRIVNQAPTPARMHLELQRSQAGVGMNAPIHSRMHLRPQHSQAGLGRNSPLRSNPLEDNRGTKRSRFNGYRMLQEDNGPSKKRRRSDCSSSDENIDLVALHGPKKPCRPGQLGVPATTFHPTPGTLSFSPSRELHETSGNDTETVEHTRINNTVPGSEPLPAVEFLVSQNGQWSQQQSYQPDQYELDGSQWNFNQDYNLTRFDNGLTTEEYVTNMAPVPNGGQHGSSLDGLTANGNGFVLGEVSDSDTAAHVQDSAQSTQPDQPIPQGNTLDNYSMGLGPDGQDANEYLDEYLLRSDLATNTLSSQQTQGEVEEAAVSPWYIDPALLIPSGVQSSTSNHNQNYGNDEDNDKGSEDWRV
jgi:hypothetical protein